MREQLVWPSAEDTEDKKKGLNNDILTKLVCQDDEDLAGLSHRPRHLPK